MTDLAIAPTAGRPGQIIAAARALLEAEGPEALTMRRLADRVGVKAPSLYKHFPDKSSVVAALAAEMLRETAGVLEAAERAAPGSFSALATAYRSYALAHPHLYLLTMGRALPAVGPGQGGLGLRPRDGRPGAQRPFPAGRRPLGGMGGRHRGLHPRPRRVAWPSRQTSRADGRVRIPGSSRGTSGLHRAG